MGFAVHLYHIKKKIMVVTENIVPAEKAIHSIKWPNGLTASVLEHEGLISTIVFLDEQGLGFHFAPDILNIRNSQWQRWPDLFSDRRRIFLTKNYSLAKLEALDGDWLMGRVHRFSREDQSIRDFWGKPLSIRTKQETVMEAEFSPKGEFDQFLKKLKRIEWIWRVRISRTPELQVSFDYLAPQKIWDRMEAAPNYWTELVNIIKES